ncbi:cactin homolog, putative [Plasmodium sp. DRC-Itaito]|nr:cactin homolog, putative [Plasmodium sp. DRC-Itaito]
MSSNESSDEKFSSGYALSHINEKNKNKNKNKNKKYNKYDKYDQHKRDTSSLCSSHSSYISNVSVVRDERRKKKKYEEKKRSYHNKNSDDDNDDDSDDDSDDDHCVKKRKHKKEKHKRDSNVLDDQIKNKKENNLTVKELKKERENLMKKHFNYTDECNPFGDNTLSAPFVWKLKNKYEKIKNHKKIKLTTNSLLENCVSKINEIEQVKKRREDREKERQMIEDHRLQLEKQKNQINIKEYMEKEHLFFFNQEIHFSNKRIKHKDIQPIDIFRTAIQILKGEEDLQKSIGINNYTMPFNKILEGLREKELVNCERQIKLFLIHDKMFNAEKYEKFWNALLFFCKYYLDKIQLKEQENNYIDDSTDNKIESFFLNKTYDELITYEYKIKEKLLMEESTNKDVNYWNMILFKIPYYKSKYILKRFQEKLEKMLNKIDNTIEYSHRELQVKTSRKNIRLSEEKQERIPYDCESPILYDINFLEKNKNKKESVYNSEEELKERKRIYENILIKLKGKEEDDLSILSYVKGGNNKNMELNDEVYDKMKFDVMNDDDRCFHFESLTEDIKNKDNLNKLFMEDKKIYDIFVQREKKKGIKDIIIMKDIIPHNLVKTATLLKDNLFVARKPLYFNRIKTSFDWNKYNKTHYDYENTPPKYICGYKFNIFYTNLINKNHKPTWKLYPSKDDDTKVIIIFHGGIPYLDVAFKIINAEWSLDKNKGFRNIFDRGILQLYFNFKKKRYRR